MSTGEEKWNSAPPASAGKRKAEPPAWTPDSADANANGKDWGRNWSDRSIFSGIGKNSSGGGNVIHVKLAIFFRIGDGKQMISRNIPKLGMVMHAWDPSAC